MSRIAPETRRPDPPAVRTPPDVWGPALIATATLVTVDAALGQGPVDHRFVLALIGMATLAGLALAACLDLLLYRLPRVAGVGRALTVGGPLAAGAALAVRLQVPSRLGGPYHSLAMLTGAACLVAGAAGGLLLQILQSRPDGRVGIAFGWSRLHRALLSAALLAAAAGASVADRLLYVGLYGSAHIALRLAAALLLASAILPISPHVWRPPIAARPLALALGLVLPLWALRGDAGQQALRAFAWRPIASDLLTAMRFPLDWDGDGFASLLGGGDCDDANPAIHPAAQEIPDNGIDDNCLFGDAHAEAETIDVPMVAGPPPDLNVVLVTIDALRWDRLGLNDIAFAEGTRDTTPRLSAWGRDALNFRRAYTPGAWTSLSLAALLHGRYPRQLTWVPHYETSHYRMLTHRDSEALEDGETILYMFPLAWRDPHQNLPQLLSDRGLYTAAVVDDAFTGVLSRAFGANEGFDNYWEVNPRAGHGARANDARTVRIALSALTGARLRKRPFFLWVHLFGAHGPNTVHPGVRLDSDSEEDGYDHEVRYADQQLSELLDALSTDDHTAVFVTSDHGEEIHPSYRAHGASLREELLRVPLLARVPGWPSGHHDGLVSLVDLLPTIVKLVGGALPAGLAGMDLTPVVTGRAADPHRVLLSDTWRYDAGGVTWLDRIAAYDGRDKLELDILRHVFTRSHQTGLQDAASGGPVLPDDPLGRALRRYVETAKPVVATPR